jgi:hypothetical protein
VHLLVERPLIVRRRKKLESVAGHRFKLKNSHKTMPDKTKLLQNAPSY